MCALNDLLLVKITHRIINGDHTEILSIFVIPLSMSPVSFFVEEKEGSLHPCIEYHGLNYVIIKYIPLVDSAFGPLHQASIFSKLDLRNARH